MDGWIHRGGMDELIEYFINNRDERKYIFYKST